MGSDESKCRLLLAFNLVAFVERLDSVYGEHYFHAVEFNVLPCQLSIEICRSFISGWYSTFPIKSGKLKIKNASLL